MDYSKMKKKELKAICRERKIKGFSGKCKEELIEMIELNDAKAGPGQNLVVNTHVKIKPTVPVEMAQDTYTKELLKEQFALHMAYVKGRISTTKKIGVKVRLPCIPEDISENMVKFIIHNKLGDKSSSWSCIKGDLFSSKEGKQECKCFTSDGPPSFTPSSEWDSIYFLDARLWLEDKFVCYRVALKKSSEEWKNIKVSKSQTFDDQCKQGRRPRLTWESLNPQISSFTTKIYEGTFENMFTPPEAVE